MRSRMQQDGAATAWKRPDTSHAFINNTAYATSVCTNQIILLHTDTQL